MFLSEWREFPSAPCLARKKTWWQLASRCCWNRARPWHASEIVSFLVGLRTYQHLGIIHRSIFISLSNKISSSFAIYLQEYSQAIPHTYTFCSNISCLFLFVISWLLRACSEAQNFTNCLSTYSLLFLRLAALDSTQQHQLQHKGCNFGA